jgi:hypothetical protein
MFQHLSMAGIGKPGSKELKSSSKPKPLQALRAVFVEQPFA